MRTILDGMNLVRHWQIIDNECRTEREQRPDIPSHTWLPYVVLLTAGIALTVREYVGSRGVFAQLYPRVPDDPFYLLKAYTWWSGWRLIGYMGLPMLAIALVPGERIRDYFLRGRGYLNHLWIYALLFLAMVPVVMISAQTASFSAKYPLYPLAHRSTFDFLAWEAVYFGQFVALEFFFRGFLLHGLARSVGSTAIFIMAIPYCMVHFGKPLPETLAAIGAGVVLGTLALRTRSIWGGVTIHVAVALTMDVLALQGKSG